jgi:hypothetical protein
MLLDLTKSLLIQRNEVKSFALGPFENEKYGYACYLMKGKDTYKLLFACETGKFRTCKEAIDSAEKIVEKIRDLDLPTDKYKINQII